MSAFFNFIRETFEAVFRNIGRFFVTVFAEPWIGFGSDFSEYGLIYSTYSPNFEAGGWILYVIFIILVVALFASIGYFIYYIIRKAVFLNNRRVTKERLVEEVQKLNKELFLAIQEKNEILKLKAETFGIGPEGKSTDVSENERRVMEAFPKLGAIDKQYIGADTTIVVPPSDLGLSLEQLVLRFQKFAASQLGLHYDLHVIRTFFSALGTTKFIILEGISGTGKTSLPYAVGKFFKRDVTICSVQPSWRERTEMLGYFNEFTKKFNETEFLRAIYEAAYREDNNIIVLDEMNLARVEYYFADFLSIMEMPVHDEWKIEVTRTADNMNPKKLQGGKLLLTQNIWFVGTANNDDSTFTITDKVYDRAISISLSDKGETVDTEYTEGVFMPYAYLAKLFEQALSNYPISKTNLAKFEKLDKIIADRFRIAFGNRIIKQMRSFVANFVACGGTEIDALDFMFSSKVLKKFTSLNLAFMHDELNDLSSELDKLFGKGAFWQSQKVISDYLKIS
ncbi:MAG: hypothetical protein WC344_02525 [Bacilli bacterium]|jgi:hypothetical protein